MSQSKYEYAFDPDAPNNTAATVFRVTRAQGRRVLDVGSGPGIVSGALVHLADKDVTCLDLAEHHLEEAARRGAQRTVQSDLRRRDWAADLVGERFDAIILADVLEHLVDPSEILRDIRTQGLLDADGSLVISIPNSSHASILASLTAGDFPYRPTGLLDETHLRFFTLRSIRRLLEANGFGITEVHRTTRLVKETELFDVVATLDLDLVRNLERANEESDVYQYVLRAQLLPRSTPPVAAAELDALRRRVRSLEGKRKRERRELASLRQENTKLEQEVRRQRDAYESKLTEVYNSSTWRAGRALVAGPGWVKRARRRR